jgi:hypothetical protein
MAAVIVSLMFLSAISLLHGTAQLTTTTLQVSLPDPGNACLLPEKSRHSRDLYLNEEGDFCVARDGPSIPFKEAQEALLKTLVSLLGMGRGEGGHRN